MNSSHLYSMFTGIFSPFAAGAKPTTKLHRSPLKTPSPVSRRDRGLSRRQLVRAALESGLPLQQLEDYFDHLDAAGNER